MTIIRITLDILQVLISIQTIKYHQKQLIILLIQCIVVYINQCFIGNVWAVMLIVPMPSEYSNTRPIINIGYGEDVLQ